MEKTVGADGKSRPSTKANGASETIARAKASHFTPSIAGETTETTAAGAGEVDAAASAANYAAADQTFSASAFAEEVSSAPEQTGAPGTAPAADAPGTAPAADAPGTAPAADVPGTAPAADAPGTAPAVDAPGVPQAGVPHARGMSGVPDAEFEDDAAASDEASSANTFAENTFSAEKKPGETLIGHWRRCPAELGALLDAVGIEGVIEVLSPNLDAALQTRVRLLREIDNADAAQLLLDAFGWKRLCTIIGKVTELRTPKGRKASTTPSLSRR